MTTSVDDRRRTPGSRTRPTPQLRAPGVRRGIAALLALAAAAGASSALSPLAPLGVAVVAALAVAVWRRPLVAAVVVVAVVPAVAGLDRGVGAPGLKASELLLALCAGVLVLRSPQPWGRWSSREHLLLVFAVTAAALSVYHAAVTGSTVDSLLRVGLQPALLLLTWWTARRGVADRADLVVVLRWTLLVSAVPSALAVLQYLDVLGVRDLVLAVTAGDVVPDAGSDFSRVTGPFPIWHSLGGYLLIPTVLAMILVLVGDRTVLRPWALGVVVALDLAAVVLSVTVTVIVWVPVAFLVAAVLVHRTGRALLLLAGLVLVAALAFQSILVDRIEDQSTAASGTSEGLLPQTVAYRVLVWQRDYLPLLARGAAYGLGNDLPDSVFFPSTENQYLTYVLRGGVVLLAAAIAAVVAVLVRSLAVARSGAGPEALAAAAIAGVLAFLPATAMLWPYLSNAGLPAMLFAAGGAVLGGRARESAPPGRSGGAQSAPTRRAAPAGAPS
ncbi:hypothetical protein [uncultured Pseudokineococcus sp.]|uniref:hypothetical protein n=1 Tax=uncultured Pseudokineococcus sp. TaxID=1642928 RepID=UPI002628C8BB|nr:hypothetical protein [uncultured Pseudokineococcus sp.]